MNASCSTSDKEVKYAFQPHTRTCRDEYFSGCFFASKSVSGEKNTQQKKVPTKGELAAVKAVFASVGVPVLDF